MNASWLETNMSATNSATAAASSAALTSVTAANRRRRPRRRLQPVGGQHGQPAERGDDGQRDHGRVAAVADQRGRRHERRHRGGEDEAGPHGAKR